MTQNNFAKIAIIGSVLLHFIIVAIIVTATKNDEIATRFIVLGAHSKNVLHATYKSMPLPAFQKTPSGKSGASVKSTQPKIIKKQLPKVKPLPRQKKRTIPKKEKIPLKKMPTSIIEETKALKIPEKLRRQESDEICEPVKKKKSSLTQKELVQKEEQILANDEDLQTSEEKEADEEAPGIENSSDHSTELESININLSQLSKELTVYQECVQREVLRLWSPPIGIPKGTECTLHFIISDTGKISHVDFIKRSKMLLYDLSIQQVAYRFEFDKRLWGKQFTIDFRQ